MEYNVAFIKTWLGRLCKAVSTNKLELERLDSFSGDGDLGISMCKGTEATLIEVEKYTGTDIGGLFLNCALAFNNAAPSTMGTLISAGMMMLGKSCKGKECLSVQELLEFPQIIADAISKRGRAQEGDRTILDALCPFARTLKECYAQEQDCRKAMERAVTAAKDGIAKTADMVPKVGRSKWNASNAKGIVDAGASLCGIVVQALLE